jgi:predicted nuclease of predicted toxin-antitoxin system
MILRRAFAEERIVVTNDKDFGELIFRLQEPHHGVILLRLQDEIGNNGNTSHDGSDDTIRFPTSRTIYSSV